jgi:hypothetical protein
MVNKLTALQTKICYMIINVHVLLVNNSYRKTTMQNTGAFIAFASLVIIIYSGLNYYFIRKNRSLLTRRSLTAIIIRMLLFTLILTPVATTIFSYQGIPLLAALTGFPGYSWLAFLFLFLLIHGSVDIILFTAEKAGFVPSGYMAREILIVTMVLSVSVLAYGYHEAKDIKVERLVVETDKLPAGTKELKIVQLSDVHFSPLISVDVADKIKSIVNTERPDIVVSTGDLLDRAIRNRAGVIEALNGLSAPLGKFAVTGNHEFIAGIDNSVEFISQAGFLLLRNRSISIDGIINLAGVDDSDAARFGIKIDKSEKEVLEETEPGKFTILLKHRPVIDRQTSAMFDLQLSGHTHAGQIYPLRFIVRMIFEYTAGFYMIDANTLLYVNKGLGTVGPRIRVLAPPEITVIVLKHKSNSIPAFQ